MKPEIRIIAAIADNGVIGKDNQLIWHISNDLKRFKKKTLGHPMIMGRKTFDSFPAPLKGRIHIVISRTPRENTDNVRWVNSAEDALKLAEKLDRVIYVIGGGNVYRQFMDKAHVLELTCLEKDFEGDTFFPSFNNEEWQLTESIPGVEKDFNYSFKTYHRI